MNLSIKAWKVFRSWGEKSRDWISYSPQNLCDLSRRGFIKAGILAAASAVATFSSQSAIAGLLDYLPAERILSFYNIHTGESLRTVYFSAENYLCDAVRAIHHILRDHRNDTLHVIDLSLMDLLFALRLKLDNDEPFHIISGYRSPATNAALHKHSQKVAPNSLHVLGKAIDIRLPGCGLPNLRRAALDLQAGGVGYYPRSGFIHLDVGPVRSW